MVHTKFGVGQALGAVLVSVAWIFASGAPMAAPDAEGGELQESCDGCRGLTGYGDEAYAPPPCAQSPYGAWSVAVSCDVFTGECVDSRDKEVKTCVGSPCESTVTYSWGSEVADAGLGIGYRKTFPVKGGDTTYAFPVSPPWKKGKTGAVTYDPGVNPDISCGDELTFFIKGDLCGTFEASVFGRCTPCKVPTIILPKEHKLPHGTQE